MSAFSFRNDVLGAPRSSASTSDSVLVIIDAQNEYANGKLAVKNVEQSRKVIGSLLNKYRKANGKVVHVLHQVPDGAPVFTPGSDLAKEFDELKPKDGEPTIQKQVPGAFTGTDLHKTLEGYGLKKLVLTGYMAHVCVSTTAREGMQSGYDVVIPEDAVGDRAIPGVSADEVVKVALAELGDAFATIIKSSEIS